MKFQLTHPWGCDFRRFWSTPISLNFNSHTREGVTSAEQMEQLEDMISTHTPVRVWHGTRNWTFVLYPISTHTPVRVWRLFTRHMIYSPWFQLTHPWGCDTKSIKDLALSMRISTHTPVRVWLCPISLLTNIWISTHTPVRVWRICRFIINNSLRFQLTHPWGCDLLQWLLLL